MGHFYDQAGMPCYYVTGANGRQRDSTIADAKKAKWVPSVTEVLKAIDKPALNTWKIKQGILAALTLGREDGESDDAYLARVLADSGEQARKAALEGSKIHDAIECAFLNKPYPAQYVPHVAAVHLELSKLFPGVTDWVVEKSFASPEGYGGKVDLHSPSTGITVDHKGKDGDFSDGKKLAYDQHWQLAPYQRGLCIPRNVAANLFISRTHPGAISSHVWSAEDVDQGWEVFRAALALWKALKRFDPSF